MLKLTMFFTLQPLLHMSMFSLLLTFRKIIEKSPVFKLSPIQVLCKRGGGIYCFLLTRIFGEMLKNRIKMGQFRWHLNCPRFLSFVSEKELEENREFFIKYCFNSFLKAILAFRSHRGLQKRNTESG